MITLAVTIYSMKISMASEKKKHSTELAAISTELVYRILGHLDQRNIPISVFLDLSKAFDTINHAILIQKLYFYELRAIPLKWF